MVGQAVLGALASGDGNDSTDYQVVLGVTSVHADTVVFKKIIYLNTGHVALRFLRL